METKEWEKCVVKFEWVWLYTVQNLINNIVWSSHFPSFFQAKEQIMLLTSDSG